MAFQVNMQKSPEDELVKPEIFMIDDWLFEHRTPSEEAKKEAVASHIKAMDSAFNVIDTPIPIPGRNE